MRISSSEYGFNVTSRDRENIPPPALHDAGLLPAFSYSFLKGTKLILLILFSIYFDLASKILSAKDPIVSAQMIPMAKYLSYIALPKFCIGNPILCIFPSFYCSSTHASHWCKFPYSSLSYFGCCGHLPSNLHKIFVTNIHCHFFQFNSTSTISKLFFAFFLSQVF